MDSCIDLTDLYCFIAIRRPAHKKCFIFIVFIVYIICTINRNTVIIKMRAVACGAKLKIPVSVGDRSVTYKGIG